MSEAPGRRAARNQALQQRISRGLLTDPRAAKWFMTDPVAHAEIGLLRDLVQRTDQAMQAEGISEKIRDRVAHRLIFGEAPEEPEPYDEQVLPVMPLEQVLERRLQALGLPETEPEKP